MSNEITEMKSTLEGINRINEAEEQVSDLEDGLLEITTAKQDKEKRMRNNENSLRDFWDIKCTNICIIRVTEEDEREKRPEKMFEEIIAKLFTKMGKDTLTQNQEAQRVPYRINQRRNMLRHTSIKVMKTKDKEKILKSNKGKARNNIQRDFHKLIS